VEQALAGRPVLTTYAEDYAQGLSASLKAGIAALPPDIEGVVICLGDMPLVAGAMVDRMIATFDPEEGRSIVQPTFRGKQGNPMLWGKEFFPEMMAITGDVGARHLAGKHADRVAEVEMADDAVLRDFDTTDALKKAPGFAAVR
jgi:molybdenum cofactor cytidylyltransferase